MRYEGLVVAGSADGTLDEMSAWPGCQRRHHITPRHLPSFPPNDSARLQHQSLIPTNGTFGVLATGMPTLFVLDSQPQTA